MSIAPTYNAQGKNGNLQQPKYKLHQPWPAFSP